jgi:hypothetical protein
MFQSKLDQNIRLKIMHLPMSWYDSKIFVVYRQFMGQLMSFHIQIQISLNATSNNCWLLQKIHECFCKDAWFNEWCSNIVHFQFVPKCHQWKFIPTKSWDKGFKPYIIGIKGYPLMPWLMILHKQIANAWHMILEALYNVWAKTFLGGTTKNITP